MIPKTFKRWAVKFFEIVRAIENPPKGIVGSTEEWLASGSSSAAGCSRRILFSESRRERRLPRNLRGNLPWEFQSFYGGTSVQEQSGWVAEIPGGRVAGKCGVLTPDGYLLGDVSREQIVGGDQSKHSVFQLRGLPKCRRIKGTVAVISVASIKYWHWIFDVLPRVLLLKQDQEGFDGIDFFVANRMQEAYQRETLEMMGVPGKKIIESRRYGFHISADRLLVPSVFREVPAQWACKAIGESFRIGEPGMGTPDRRIYVSRADANSRRVLNEDMLMDRLSRRGFEKVTLTGMSFTEQVTLFASAKFIVAPHGSGLTNLVFCSPGTSVLEIFAPNYVNSCYWVVSDHMDLNYYFVIGEGLHPPPPPKNINCGIWRDSFKNADSRYGKDIMVEVDEVLDLVDRAISEST